MLADTAQAAQVFKLNQKLRLADEELDRVNKRFDETQGMRHYYIPKVICVLICLNLLNVMTILTVGAAKVESLKSTLAQAKKEVEVSKVAADKTAREIEVEQTTH